MTEGPTRSDDVSVVIRPDKNQKLSRPGPAMGSPASPPPLEENEEINRTVHLPTGDTDASPGAHSQAASILEDSPTWASNIPAVGEALFVDTNETAPELEGLPGEVDTHPTDTTAPGPSLPLPSPDSKKKSVMLSRRGEDGQALAASGGSQAFQSEEGGDASTRRSLFDSFFRSGRVVAFIDAVRSAFGDDDSIITTWVLDSPQRERCTGPVGDLMFVSCRIIFLALVPTLMGLIWNSMPLKDEDQPWQDQILYFWGYLPMFRLLIGALPCTWIPGFLSEQITFWTLLWSFVPGLIGPAITLGISAGSGVTGVPAHAFVIGIPIFVVQCFCVLFALPKWKERYWTSSWGFKRWLFCTFICMFAPALWLAVVLYTSLVVLAAQHKQAFVEGMLVFIFPTFGYYLVYFARNVLRKTRRKMEIAGAMLPEMVTTMYMSILFPTIRVWVFWMSALQRCLFLAYPAYTIIREHNRAVRRVTSTGEYRRAKQPQRSFTLESCCRCLWSNLLLVLTCGYGMETLPNVHSPNTQRKNPEAFMASRRHSALAKYLTAHTTQHLRDHNDIEEGAAADNGNTEDQQQQQQQESDVAAMFSMQPPVKQVTIGHLHADNKAVPDDVLSPQSQTSDFQASSQSDEPPQQQQQQQQPIPQRKSVTVAEKAKEMEQLDKELEAYQAKRRSSIKSLVASTGRRSSAIVSLVRGGTGELLSIYTLDDRIFEDVTAAFGTFLIQAFTEIIGPFQVFLYMWYIRNVAPSGHLYPAFTDLSQEAFDRFFMFTVFTTVFNSITTYLVLSICKPYLPTPRRMLVSKFLGEWTFLLVMLGSLTISPVYPIVLLTPHNHFPLDLSVTRVRD